METLFDQYKELNINGSLICLEQVEDIYSYFCYPTNAKAIGFEGSIMYCFIEPYGEMVFACNPDTCADVFVYPLARTFEDFMRLILACGSTNPIDIINLGAASKRSTIFGSLPKGITLSMAKVYTLLLFS